MIIFHGIEPSMTAAATAAFADADKSLRGFLVLRCMNEHGWDLDLGDKPHAARGKIVWKRIAP